MRREPAPSPSPRRSPRRARTAAWAAGALLLLVGCTRPAVLAVTIDQAAPSLQIGDQAVLTATVTVAGSASRALDWSSGDATVARVQDGVVTAFGAGAAWITARSRFDPSVSDAVRVTVSDPSVDGFACSQLGGFATADGATAGERVLVRYRRDLLAAASARAAAAAPAVALAATLGATRVREGLGGESDLFMVPAERVDELLAALRRRPEVAHAIRDVELARAAPPADPLYLPNQWNLATFGAEAAWGIVDALPAPAPRVVIAVVDDGVAVDHPDLRPVVLPGWDAADDDADPRNCVDHGTHVAGIAAAVRGNARGVAGVGSAAGIVLLPVKAWADTTNANATTSFSTVERAVRWAVGLPVSGAPANPNPADVVNLSLGAPATTVDAHTAAMFVALLDDVAARGVTVVAAAGNGGTSGGVDYPARAGGIAVGSVDATGVRSGFSTYGAGLTLMAPGGFGPSSCGMVASTGLLYDGATHSVSHAYVCKAGTSMATPYVAGAVALLIAAEPSLRGDPDAIRARLVAAAGLRPGGGAAEYGAGILCLDALLGTGTVCGVP